MIKISKKTVWFGIAAMVVALAGGLLGFYWSRGYTLGPSAENSVKISRIETPSFTVYDDKEQILPQPLYVNFSAAAAPLDKIDVPLQTGIKIQPAIRGKWQWISDRRLMFTPETDWLPDTSYKVNLSKSIFSPQIKLKDSSFRFNAPAFTGNVISSEFYEDPRNLNNKAVTAGFQFTYPLDTEELKNSIRVRTVSGENYDFDYKLDKHNTVLYVVSKPVNIKDEEDFAKITLSHIRNAYNQKSLKTYPEATVKIPSSTTFFKLNNIFSSIVKNKQKNDNPEQILTVAFTTAVNSRQLAEAFSLNYIQENCTKLREILAQKDGFNTISSKLIPLETTEVSVERENAKTHLFKYDTPQNDGCLLASIDNGLSSPEGFKLGKDNSSTLIAVNLSPYPLEAEIAFDGAVMPLQGNRQVAFVSRGAKELDVDIARIKETDLNHLITQTYGNFSHPFFDSYNFSENNIAEIFHKKLPINTTNPAKADYSTLNLNEYFQSRKGVFLLTLKGKNGYRNSNPSQRLLVLTDLGIVIKDNADKTHDVFISNIVNEKPVSGAYVQVLGRNGLPVLSAVTNQDGVAKIGDFSTFENEKYAVVYKVSKDNDISFLPVNRGDRILNLSRFDIGGEYLDDIIGKNGTQMALKGYIFSDRGIYRPAETGHLGIVLRQSDLNIPNRLPLELNIRKPNGDIMATQQLQSNDYGFMEYTFKLATNAPTGTYSAELLLKDKENRKRFITSSTFNVAEFTPDTLKIAARWEPDMPKGWFDSTKLKADVNLQNLYGNPAAQHILQADYALMPATFQFDLYKGYIFRDPLQSDKVRSYQDTLTPEKTDKDGHAVLELDLSTFEQGTYNLRLNIDGLEGGSARGVGTSLSALVSPADYLIGWKADGKLAYIHKNSQREISFIAVDNNLQQIEKQGLKLQLAKKKYVSSLVEQKNGTYDYQMVAKEQIIQNKPFEISENGQNELLTTAEAGDYSLSILDADNLLLAKIDYTVAGAENLNYALNKDAQLGLKLNKTEYTGGETIEMQITAPYGGYGLITIERDNVYAYKWFKTETPSVTEKIKLPENIEGNAYVNVAFFRSWQSQEIYLSPLSYATVPFSINKNKRRLNIDLDTPSLVKPGDNLVIRYTTSEPAEIVIYGVNEGILQVAKYKTPNLLNTFMSKRALRVVTQQIMDLVMPDIKFLRRLSSSGGDGSDSGGLPDTNLNPFARKTDKPAAFWSGIIKSDKDGGVYTYRVPESFNGTIRIMAEAVSTTRFGSTEQAVLVHGDYALTPSGPYNVAPNDEFVIGLSISNLQDDTVGREEILTTVTYSDGLEIIGESQQKVTLASKEETLLKFRFKAKQKLGAEEIIFKSESLADSEKHASMTYNLGIRPAVPYSSKFNMGMAKSSYTLDKAEDLYDEYRIQQLSASHSPLILAQGLLQYLDKYPHFCTEQTVSKVFPALELFFKSPQLVQNLDIYALFDDAVRILRERQTLNGGFTAWTNNSSVTDERASLYAAHFLVLAQQHGFNVPSRLLSSALSYCKSIAAGKPQNPDDMSPAYAAYILTVNGQITTNYLLNLEEFYKKEYGKNWQTGIGAEFLAASYKLLQDEKKADLLAGQYENGKDTVLNAVNVYLLAKHFPHKLKNSDKQSIEQLLQPLSSGNFTTYSAGWSVLALNAMTSQTEDTNIKFSEMTPEYTPFPTVAYTYPVKKLSVEAPSAFYYVNTQQGFRKDADISATAAGLEVSKSFYDKNGQPVNSAQPGDVLTVKVSYRSLGKDAVFDTVLVDLLAGCFEVVDNSLTLDDGADYADIREDRINVYATAFVYKQSFSYKVKVISEGSFSLPPVYGSAMYQPLIRANSSLNRITVGE